VFFGNLADLKSPPAWDSVSTIQRNPSLLFWSACVLSSACAMFADIRAFSELAGTNALSLLDEVVSISCNAANHVQCCSLRAGAWP
jgi:hypothetical protein